MSRVDEARDAKRSAVAACIGGENSSSTASAVG